jgi:hypothetical protein
MSFDTKHPLRVTLVGSLWMPFVGLLMHLAVAVSGLLENRFSLKFTEQAGVTTVYPIVITLFFVGVTVSTVSGLIAAFRLASVRKELELPTVSRILAAREPSSVQDDSG